MTLTAYYKIEMLTDEVKALNKIKVGAIVPRLDCTAYAGDYNGLEAFINAKGQMFFYLQPTNRIVESKSNKYAEYCLTGGKNLNFGSLYKYLDYPTFAYSYPNKKAFTHNGDANPLFSFGDDLYLIIKTPNYSKLEVLIIRNGRSIAEQYLQKLIDGDFDAEIDVFRKEATPLYSYIGYNSNL